ncbi:Bardet-Biedl syndrome 4 protein [Phlyctochytrium bullatum]|nr:Bardet-Biedl syndrome 4 protein [Phlyctochytrium bullatum]
MSPLDHDLSWRIHQLYVSGQHDECLALIAALEDAGEGSKSAEHGLLVRAKGLICRASGEITEALELSREFGKLDPTNVMNLKNMARCLYLQHRIGEALGVYEEAMKYAGNDWAEETFRKALSIHTHESTFNHLGRMLLTLEKRMEAAELYSQAVSVNPENVEYLTQLGLIWLNEKDFKKAREFLEKALAHDPRALKAVVGLASIFQQTGDYDGALIKYRLAVMQSPGSPQIWNNIGLCFAGKGKMVAAISCLKHAGYLDPFNVSISANLALCYVQAGQYASAARYFHCCERLEPGHALARDWMPFVQEKLNKSSSEKSGEADTGNVMQVESENKG